MMITFVIGFLVAFSALTSFLSALFASVDAINSICVVVVLGSLTIGAITHNAYAFLTMFLGILFMVAVPFLAPYESALEIIGSALIAVWFAYTMRRHVINPFMRSPGTKPAWLLALSRFL